MDPRKKAQAAILERLGQSGALLRRQRLKAHLAPKETPKPKEEKPPEADVDLGEVYANLTQ